MTQLAATSSSPRSRSSGSPAQTRASIEASACCKSETTVPVPVAPRCCRRGPACAVGCHNLHHSPVDAALRHLRPHPHDLSIGSSSCLMTWDGGDFRRDIARELDGLVGLADRGAASMGARDQGRDQGEIWNDFEEEAASLSHRS
jgi:hypothetical protein